MTHNEPDFWKVFFAVGLMMFAVMIVLYRWLGWLGR